jgi:hypothetical protein
MERKINGGGDLCKPPPLRMSGSDVKSTLGRLLPNPMNLGGGGGETHTHTPLYRLIQNYLSECFRDCNIAPTCVASAVGK